MGVVSLELVLPYSAGSEKWPNDAHKMQFVLKSGFRNKNRNVAKLIHYIWTLKDNE